MTLLADHIFPHMFFLPIKWCNFLDCAQSVEHFLEILNKLRTIVTNLNALYM